MSLEPLPPVVTAMIADDQLTFPWDEWRVREYYYFDDELLLQSLAPVSGRGSLALTMAAGEWVCQRFSRLSVDRTPWHFFEASWASEMAPGSSKYTEIVEDDWRGVVRGPLAIAITIANDALFCLDEDPNTAARAAWMINLARHVLPKRERFEEWLAIVVGRLTEHHPREGADAESLPIDQFGLGRPVAREIFDSTRTFLAAEEAVLIQRFLKLVNQQNPFLTTDALGNAE